MNRPLAVQPESAEEILRLQERIRRLEEDLAAQRSRPTSDPLASNRYRLLYEDTPSMSFALYPDGTVCSVNRFGAEQLGFQQDELVGQSVLTIFDAADHPTVKEQLILCAQHPYKIFQWEIQKVHRTGRRLWVKETARSVRDENGSLIILVMCEEITARRAAEEQARGLTKTLETLIRTSPLAIMALDNQGETVTLWNHAAEAMFGWTEEETLGRPTPFLPSDRQAESDLLWSELLETGELQGKELYRRRKDGSPIILSLWARVLRDSEGRISNTFGLLADITERKHMERSLLLNERAIRELYEITSETTTDFDNQIRMLLDLGRRRFQLPIGAFTTLKGTQLELTSVRSDGEIPQEGALLPLCDTYCSQSLLADHPLAYTHIGNSEWKSLPAYSQLRFESYLGVRITVGGNPWGTLCFLSDTPTAHPFSDADLDFLQLMARWVGNELERRQAEANLRDSEERFRRMFEHAPIGMCIVNQDRTIRKINPALQQLIGYREEDIVGHTYEKYTHPDDFPGNVDLTDRLLRGTIPSYTLEKRYLRKDGSCIWVNVTASQLRLPAESDRVILAVIEDITDRKKAESALRFTQFAVDHAGDLIFWIDRHARLLYVNEAASKRLGYSGDELSGMTVADIDPLYQADVWPHHWEELRTKKKLRFESCHRTKAGEVYPAEIVANFVDFEGQEYNFAFARDISERQASEAALRASEEHFSQAFRLSPYPIGITDLETGMCMDINDAATAIFGYTRDEAVGRTTFTLGIWPDQKARERFIAQVKREGSVKNLEVTLKSKQGESRQFLASCEPIKLNGKDCLVTIANDITERKRAEEALRRSEQEVRRAFDERERLSQDLHDNLLQSLYAIGMGLELTKQRIERSSRIDANRLEQSVAQLNAVIHDVRNFIPCVDTPTGKSEDVCDALRGLINSFHSTGANEIALSIDPTAAADLSPEQIPHVLAIAREAISNSLRHADTDHRSITMTHFRRQVRLEVFDDGKGFQLRERSRHGMGIRNMRARAAKINARFTIRTSRGAGTRLTLTLPRTRR